MGGVEPWLPLAGEATLWAVLAVSVATDLMRGMVYNWATLPAAGLGLLLAGVLYGAPGLLSAGLGLLAGVAIFLLPFLLGALGGGDVKLLAAVGSLTGPLLALKTALYACVLGGVAALVLLVARGALLRVLADTARFFAALVLPGQSPAAPRSAGLPQLPFALCIAGGLIWARYFDLLT